jgi:S1-C subfamily serine protease
MPSSQLDQSVHSNGRAIRSLTGADGALIGSVAPNSPGAAAGLQKGDLVIAVDGKAIHDANGLVSAIQAAQPGDKLTLTVQRASQHLSLTATLGAQPKNP